jgi:hypothetical protein
MKSGKTTMIKRICITLAALAMLGPTMGGCNDQAAIDEFRTVAAGGLAEGLQVMFGAFIDGVFAVVEPNAEEE